MSRKHFETAAEAAKRYHTNDTDTWTEAVKWADEEIKNLEERNTKLEKTLEAYIYAINHLDDYFEYARESKIDADRVYDTLHNLTTKLRDIHNDKENSKSIIKGW